MQALEAFVDGTMQRSMPSIPIKVVNTDTMNYDKFYWTRWFDGYDMPPQVCSRV